MPVIRSGKKRPHSRSETKAIMMIGLARTPDLPGLLSLIFFAYKCPNDSSMSIALIPTNGAITPPTP
jgi:hypothetical protein